MDLDSLNDFVVPSFENIALCTQLENPNGGSTCTLVLKSWRAKPAICVQRLLSVGQKTIVSKPKVRNLCMASSRAKTHVSALLAVKGSATTSPHIGATPVNAASVGGLF